MFFECTVKHGFVKSSVKLALHLMDGIGVEPNKERAFHLFLEAANKGDLTATCAVARYATRLHLYSGRLMLAWVSMTKQCCSCRCYENGDGTARDLLEARKWFRVGA